LNKLLLSSVSLDKSIIFYDITQKKKVSVIQTQYPLQSITFNHDGHTVAVGAQNSGHILVYDLRKQSEVMAMLEGHKGTVNSLAFKHGESGKSVTPVNK